MQISSGELISVIVPVYNMEKYLKGCVDSIRAQTYSQLEIILIDDGSSDSSGKICDKLAQKDARIRVIHKENSGISDCRNLGVSQAGGRFVTFVDADDVVTEKYVEHLTEALIRGDADIAVTLHSKFRDGKKPLKKSEPKRSKDYLIVYSPEYAIENMLYQHQLPVYAWGKLYKKELFDQVSFPAGELYEDLSTIYKLFDKCERIALSPLCDYGYRQHKGSLSRVSSLKQKMEQISICENILSFVRENYPLIEGAAISRLFVTTLNLYRSIPGKKEFKKERTRCERVLRQYKSYVRKDRNNDGFTRMKASLCLINRR